MPHPLDRYRALITTEELDPADVQAMFRLRKRLFVDQCGWMLSTVGDLERDQFDAWYTEHCLLFCGPDLVGGFRAIRTDYPYLTQSIFPQLAVRRFPNRRDVWEISRFGVLPVAAEARSTRLNYALMFRFADCAAPRPWSRWPTLATSASCSGWISAPAASARRR